MAMHQEMAKTLDRAVRDIRGVQSAARSGQRADRPIWPMVILRSPKGWTGPKEVDGLKIEGFWRSHQVPVTGVHHDPARLKVLEDWLKSYAPERLFDENGTLRPELKALAPAGARRMSANPVTSGLTKRRLRLPDFRDYAVAVDSPGRTAAENTRPMGAFLRDVLLKNKDNFRVFGPDETRSTSCRVYEASKKPWMAEMQPENAGGCELARDAG